MDYTRNIIKLVLSSILILNINYSVQLVNSLVVDLPCCSIYPHADAMFGAELNDAGITGKLTVIDPKSGCTNKFPTQNLNQSIALIPRGTCSFGEKVFYAQMSSASAVIVFNNDGDDLIAMSAEERFAENIIIPAAFVGESTGIQLLHFLEFNEEVIVTINKTDTKIGPSGLPALDSQLTLMMFEAVCLMWCLIFLCYVISCVRKCCKVNERQRAVNNLETKTFYREHDSESSASDNDNDVSATNGEEYQRMVDDMYGGDDDAINYNKQNSSFKKKKKAGKKQLSSVHASAYDIDNCVICLDDFNNGDKLTVLPCGHEFHKQCISPWLLSRSTLCPICKMAAVKKNIGDDAGSDNDENDDSNTNNMDDIESRGRQTGTSDETSLLTPLRNDGNSFDDNGDGSEQTGATCQCNCFNSSRVRIFARMGTIVAVGMTLTGILVMVVLLQLTGQ